MGETSVAFVAEHFEGGELVRLCSDEASPNGQGLAVEDWSVLAPPGSSAAVDHLLSTWADDALASDERPLAMLSGQSLLLHPELVASLTEEQACAIGLPRSTPLTLELNARGIFPREDFELEIVWRRPGNRATRVTNSGARQTRSNQDWRIPEPIFSALKTAEKLNSASTREEKQVALAELRAVLDNAAGSTELDPDLFLSKLRVRYAAGFSLDLKSSSAGFDFDPVLFAPSILEHVEDDSTLDQDSDSLLTELQLESFQQQFRGSSEPRLSYVLNDGSLLFLDASLSGALGVVRAAQQAETNEKKAFARNPRRYIATALGRADEGDARLHDTFIETKQYSERVAGIDIWRQPVLPWIQPTPNKWLPEKFGLQVGEGDQKVVLELRPEEVSDARLKVTDAIAARAECVSIGGVEVPATQKTLDALNDLVTLSELEEDRGAGEAPRALPETLKNRYFLQVADNLEEVIYAPLRGPDSPERPPEAVWPREMLSSPKAYQVTGFKWLVSSLLSGRPGCLLADDMGLGKTFQALSFLVWHRENRADRSPFLVVAPAGLLANWEAEIRRHVQDGALGSLFRAFGPGLASMRRHEGPDILTAQAGLDEKAIQEAGIVLTTYETMRDYHMSFARVNFACVVYDEAQKIKNPASQTTRAAKTLNSPFQLAMTGTPVENRLQDLWSVVDVVHPGLLGSSREFERNFPASDRTKLAELNGLLVSPKGALPPFMLRRMKSDALDGLPEKVVSKIAYEMPPVQAREYLKIVSRAMVATDDEEPGRMLRVLHRLRGASLHPFEPSQAADEKDYFQQSARTQALFEQLDVVRENGEKALIFCESLGMQSVLAGHLERRYDLPRRVDRIHGGISGDQRQEIVDRFQSAPPGFDVLIISPKAGGVGLTLTAANHVFHLSRWWNPAVEDQATDRVYRLGQTKKVFVHLLQAVHPDPSIAPNSFDKKLDELIERKRGLSSGLLAPGESASDVAELFNEVILSAPSGPRSVDQADGADGDLALDDPGAQLDDAAGSSADARSDAPSEKADAREGPPAHLAEIAAPPRQFPRRVVFRPSLARDFSIFTEPVRDRAIRTLVIRDPYGAAGSKNRAALVEFVRLLSESAHSVENVSFTTLDCDSVQTYPPETDPEQWDDLHRRWSEQFPASERPKFIRLSRRQVSDFHDREVSAQLDDGAKVFWDLGRGVDALFDKRRECRVVVTIEEGA